MTILSAHAKEVLSVFAGASEPLDVYDVVESLLSAEPTIGWGGSGRQAYQAWLRRRHSLQHAANLLEVDGQLVTVPDVEGLVISEAGRSALAAVLTDYDKTKDGV